MMTKNNLIFVLLMFFGFINSQTYSEKFKNDLGNFMRNWHIEEKPNDIMYVVAGSGYKFVSKQKEVENDGTIRYIYHFKEFKIEMGDDYGVTHYYHYLAFLFSNDSDFESFKMKLGVSPKSIFTQKEYDSYEFDFYIENDEKKVVLIRRNLNY